MKEEYETLDILEFEIDVVVEDSLWAQGQPTGDSDRGGY